MKTADFKEADFFDLTVVSSTPNQTRKPYLENDYAANIAQKRKLVDEYKNLSKEDKKKIGEIRNYFTSNSYVDLPGPERNFQMLAEEIAEQIRTTDNPLLLQVESLTQVTEIFELLHSLEDIQKLRAVYTFQKKTATNGIAEDVAQQLKHCLTQGRELFEAGKQSVTSVKPLLFFYSITAYSFGKIVLSNPIRFSLESLNGHHGLDYLHDDFSIKIGGDTPYGTFTDLFLSQPTTLFFDKDESLIRLNNQASINAFFSTNNKLKLGSLFFFIPELAPSIHNITKKYSYCKPMKIKTTIVGSGIGYEILIGDGKEELDSASFDLRLKAKSQKIDGKLKYQIGASDFQSLDLTISQDIFGNLFFVDSPLAFSMPELFIHFMILFAFSNIQRYDPPLWGKILSNHINSDVSYLISRYFSIYEQKLPYILLRQIGRNYPILK